MRLINYCGLLIVALIFLGCSQKTADEYIAEAETAIYEKKSEEAIIVLKNALGSDPKNLKARYLLGRLYHEKGNVVSAEKEMKIAFKGGYFKNEVLPLYVSSLNFLRKDEELISLVDSLTGLSSETEAAVQTYKGLALFRQNEVSRARLAIKKASELSPESPYSMYGRAKFAVYENETSDALIILDELLAANPQFMEAVLLKGQLSILEKDYDTAIISFKKYIEQKPGDAQGNILLADTLVKAEKYEEANDLVTKLLSKIPEHPHLNQLKGTINFRNGDYEAAKLSMEQAFNSGSTAPMVRLVAGLSSYQLGKLEQAHNHLVAINNILPNSHPAKRLLAEIQLKLGYTTGAVSTLSNLSDLKLDDVRLFTQASLDLMNKGDEEKASELLDIAQKLGSIETSELVRIGLLKLSMNDDSGFQDLKQAVEGEPDSAQARLALANSYVDTNQIELAIQVVKEWTEISPNEVAAHNLLATLYSKSGQMEQSEAVFETALKLLPNNPLSLKFKSEQALAEGDIEGAIAYLKQITVNNPDYLQGLFEYYVIEKKHGDPEEALAMVEKYYLENPNLVEHKLNYARVLVIEEKPRKVIEVLSSIEPSKDLPFFFWKVKADSHIALNSPRDALAIYTEWQEVNPEIKEPWFSAVFIQDGLRAYSEALDTVKRAKVFHPQDNQLAVMEAHYSFVSGNASVAQRLVNSFSQQLKDTPVVKGIQGQILYSQGKFKEAIPLLRANYSESKDGRFAIFIANAMTRLGQNDDSLTFLESHLTINPLDINVRTRLAERLMESKPNKAIVHYEEVLKSLPENIIVLNNLAWLYGEAGQIDRAVELAEQVVLLRPENPKLLDTLGTILLKQGNIDRAVEVSKKAFRLEPSNQTYRIHHEQAVKAKQ